MSLWQLISYLMLAAIPFGPACSTWDTRVVSGLSTPAQTLDWKARIAENPLGPGENIRVMGLGRTESVSYHLVQIRDREVPHVHRLHDLTVVVKQGTGVLFLGEQALVLGPGAVVLIPRGVVHYFVNQGSQPAVAFTIFAPPFEGKDTVPATPQAQTSGQSGSSSKSRR